MTVKQRQDQEERLRETISGWRCTLEHALLRLENRRRVDAQQLPYPPSTVVWLPSSPQANTSFLTLKVWSIRYSVTPEFLLDVLTTRFRSARRPSKRENELSLGLPANIFAGAAACTAVEEAIVKAYPNQENVKVKHQPLIQIQQKVDLEDPDAYQKRIYAARTAFSERLQAREKGYKRNFRKAG
jgi:hypothetical protein